MSYQLLIVDDEVLIRKALSQYIDWESLNCVVHATASNGKEAIKIIEENKIDIVITDVKMPLIDGIELSRYICKSSAIFRSSSAIKTDIAMFSSSYCFLFLLL